ncbi:MAG TPA: N-acetylmuramoyl-L-alanine amidase [Hyphomicrobiaceae bacterium]|nr:N-acetylmuramoyl-L-alanine amidase [Hyphomicrobiaceae bacterium]
MMQASIPAETALKGDRARTKFIIGLERSVDFQVFALTNPNRVFVDLPDVKLQLPPDPGPSAAGLVKSFRGGVSAPGRARIVVDVTGPVVVDKAVVEKAADGRTARLVLELVPADAAYDTKANAKRVSMHAGALGLGAGDLQPPMPRPAVSPQARALHAFKPVIVLDPGHGGDDTGATKNGAVEKDVVLAFSLTLRDKLNASGRYKVLMTRDTDTFVELNARREFAEKHLASLFVAVHADYANSKARGATIYSLRESVSNGLLRSARNEVAGNVLSDSVATAVRAVEDNVGAVREILADLARREVDFTRDRTGVFVKSVIEHMGESTNLKDSPDRSAAFVVLKSAKVPSILIELGYVTNEEDAQLLKSERWRHKVSESIVTAIDNYFSHQLARLPM